MKYSVQNSLIIKSLGGLYTIESPMGLFECKARGVFRNKGISPFVGDYCNVEDGVICEIMERKNSIIRPPLANIDQLVFVVSTCEPKPNYLILDKFISIAEFKNIEPVIIITKIDLATEKEIYDIYENVGFKIISVDYNNKNSIDNVREILSNKVSAFTGNSGTGKSTLLNAIDPKLNILTGEISQKLGRGRHTTRHAELYKLSGGGYIADTPGFSTFETNKYDMIRKEELAECFREFREYLGSCKFNDCAHICEKGCGVLEAVESGHINKNRHESYCAMYEEAKQLKEWEIR